MAMVVTVAIRLRLVDHSTGGMVFIGVPCITRIQVFTEAPDHIMEAQRLPVMDREVAEGLVFTVLAPELPEVVGPMAAMADIPEVVGAMADMAGRRIITEER